MINKIKKFFDIRRYRKKYNTVFNSYETLVLNCGEMLGLLLLENKSTTKNLASLKNKVDDLTTRISNLEITKRSK